MQTDYDYVSLYSPEGKILPLENILKSVELGTTAVAMISKDTGIIVAHTPKTDNAYPQCKVFKISKHALFTFSGITNDGLQIVDYLVNKTINERILKDRNIDDDVFEDLSVSAGYRTMYEGTRPFGAGGILVLYNEGIKLINFMPTGECNDCLAVSIGHRSQSARTVLDSTYQANMNDDDLIKLGIQSMLYAVNDITKDDVSIWKVSKDGVAEVESEAYF